MWKFKVITSARGPLATSKQIAGRPENRKTEIRTPQYARRQDRQLQNGTEWQEDKTGTKVTHSRVPRGAGGYLRNTPQHTYIYHVYQGAFSENMFSPQGTLVLLF